MGTQFLSLEQMSDEYIIAQDWIFEKHLLHLNSLKNLVITADQRWGIYEYINELEFQLTEKNSDLHLCHIDMKPVNSVDSFLEHYRAALSQKFPDIISSIKISNQKLGMLKLPELIAQKAKIKIAVFLANCHLFQRIKDPDPFLNSLWLKLRRQKDCVFCFSGNNTPFFRAQVFHPGPLSRFGRAYELSYNPFECRSTYIRKVFHDQGKNIGSRTSAMMSSMVDNHPAYLKLLTWHALIRTQSTCTIPIAEKALNDLILHYEYHFIKIVENLTPKQLSFLRAMMEGNYMFYSQETREKYQLGTSGNVAKIIQSLKNKQILNAGKRQIEMSDPIFTKWLRRHYFGLKPFLLEPQQVLKPGL